MEKDTLDLILADDHPVFRHGLFTLLSTLPIIGNIQQAANGKEVISLLESKPYDVVLMDIRMEPMNGIYTTELITKRFKAKVIGLSMFGDRRYVLEMIRNGAVGYLLKNVEKEEIILALETIRAGGKYFSSQILRMLDQNKAIEDTKPSLTPHEEKLREIMYLLCLEKSSREIGEILNLSRRTIDEYRQEISQITGSKNLAGVIKYALENDILEDEILKKKLFPDNLT